MRAFREKRSALFKTMVLPNPDEPGPKLTAMTKKETREIEDGTQFDNLGR